MAENRRKSLVKVDANDRKGLGLGFRFRSQFSFCEGTFISNPRTLRSLDVGLLISRQLFKLHRASGTIRGSVGCREKGVWQIVGCYFIMKPATAVVSSGRLQDLWPNFQVQLSTLEWKIKDDLIKAAEEGDTSSSSCVLLLLTRPQRNVCFSSHHPQVAASGPITL